MDKTQGFSFNKLLQHTDLLIAAGVLFTLLVMILPIPAWLLDILLALSLTMSIAIMLVAIYAAKPLDFSVFPTVLLFATLFRLALNVASTRLVLLHGNEGTAAAGHVIETFGNLVVGGSYIVGFVVFILLIIINFVVITKGSGRVAEVAARFILDSMPGKQMSIDADLNAGLINEDQARDRRRKVEAEADFYGAMDGASKFVRGDAIAGILITLVNIIGGLSIGVFQQGLQIVVALERYTLMTIGDGLVTQIPSLIVSTAAGIIVTRAASGNNLSNEVAKQIFFQPRAIGITGGILVLMAVMPGIPAFPFLMLALVCAGLSWGVTRHQTAEAAKEAIESQRQNDVRASDTTAPPEVDMLELQVGYGLVALVEGDKKGDLVERIFGLRKEIAKDLGIVIPKVRIKDNLELQPGGYSILIKGIEVGAGDLMSGYWLAIDSGSVETPIQGIETKEPVFGLPALWINEKQKDRAISLGYTVVDASTIIATHVTEVVRKHAHELIGRQELQGLIENLQKSHPKVVEELIPGILPLGSVLKVIQNLLREGVPVRDLLTVFETLANHGAENKTNIDALTEFVRGALARVITHRLSSGSNDLEIITMGPKTEEALINAYQRTDRGPLLNLDPGFFEKLQKALKSTLESVVFSGNPVLLVHPLVRAQIKKKFERYFPNLNVISAAEIASNAKIRLLATVEA